MDVTGKYRLYQNNVVVAEADNVITFAGRRLLLRYLAGELSRWASYISVGAGRSVPAVADKTLQAEFGRGPINLSVSNSLESKVILRATLEPLIAGNVHELGVVLIDENFSDKPTQGLLARFDRSMENVYGGTDNDVNFRVGRNSVGVSTGTTIVPVYYPGYYKDLSKYADRDSFVLGLTRLSGNARVEVQLIDDINNYFTYTFDTGSTGDYSVYQWDKIQFGRVGVPVWNNISQMTFNVSAVTGTTSVALDFFRINDNADYDTQGLVSRAVLPNSIPKDSVQELDIEYEVKFGFGFDS